MNRKFKLGCGIGCGAVLLALLILLGGFIYFTRDMGRQYEAVKDLEEQLVQEHGSSSSLPEGYLGLPTAARVADFVAIRQATDEWRRKVETTFTELLANGSEEGGLGEALRILRATRDLAPVFAGFWTKRNEVLLERDMGLGEYIYLYHLAYFSWLGKDPADGAEEAAEFMEGMGGGGRTPDAGEVERQRWARAEVHRLMVPLLQQLARRAGSGSSTEELLWAERLRAEVHALQGDAERMPFGGGLPTEMVEVLAPYREALLATYSPTVNPVELLFEDTWDDGGQEE
jgi:hypothetical protein